MIRNERQYIITKAQIKKFRKALDDFNKQKSSTHPMLIKAQKDAMESQLAELEDQAKEYEKLRAGKYKVFKGSSIADLPLGLIRARIALGLTQKQLAERVGIKEQQIQRYEETDYASASFSRIKDIIKALGLDIEEKIFLPKDTQVQRASVKHVR
ncbi:MAG TPA: helix-turn-helix transcriptional regulator [Deltaproteobacteria bacterium]|nr:helix-turn-helix transcriptional regulator [Deltaproteobacteria bacterium]